MGSSLPQSNAGTQSWGQGQGDHTMGVLTGHESLESIHIYIYIIENTHIIENIYIYTHIIYNINILNGIVDSGARGFSN